MRWVRFHGQRTERISWQRDGGAEARSGERLVRGPWGLGREEVILGGVSGPQMPRPGPQLCSEDYRVPQRTFGLGEVPSLLIIRNTASVGPRGPGPSLALSPHSLTPAVPCHPQEASSRNLVTLRVDSNGFFLYWTGPNMVRVGAGAAYSGPGRLPQTPTPSP